MKVLVTCPPMLGMKDQFLPLLERKGIEVICPDVVQTLSEEELIKLVPDVDGWIIGDDPATRKVFEAGKNGKLKAAVKWGIGVDNVDFAACKEFGIKIINTPDMFGAEVADVAVAYVIGLARELFFIDRGVRAGKWPKNRGVSLEGKTVGLIGYGDIGKNTGRRLKSLGMNLVVYDPKFSSEDDCECGEFSPWPSRVDICDFLVFTCSLSESSRGMLNKDVLSKCKAGVMVVNVARGPLICEDDLIAALQSGKVYAAALDVFEQEPLPANSPIREMPLCILGSHNGSNTTDAVAKTNVRAINELLSFLGM